MSKEKELLIKLLLDDKDALNKLNNAIEQINTQSRTATDSMNISWAGLASKFYLAEKALQPVIAFMSGAVREASEQEDAIRRLNFALQLQGVNAEQVSKKYQSMAESLQKTTRYSDDAILRVQQTLITIGRVAPENMEKVTRAVLDFATATGVSLDTAGDLFAKAFAGNTQALSRYGIVIDETIPKAQRAAELLRITNQQMGGAAQADIETYSGKVAQTKNAYADFLKELGRFVTESETVKAAMAAMSRAAAKASEDLASLRTTQVSQAEQTFAAFQSMMGPGMVMGFQGPAVTLVEGVLGSESDNEDDAESLGVIVNEAAQKAMDAWEALRSQNQATTKQSADFFKSMEDIKLESVVANTDIIKRLKQEETVQFIDAERLKIESAIASDLTEIESKQRLLEMYVALGQAKDTILNPVNKEDEAEQARLAELFTINENMKLSTLLQNTEIADQIRRQSTMRTLALAQQELMAKKQLSEAELKQLQAIEQAKAAIQKAEAKARFETAKSYGLATADLMEALSIATGKGQLKGVAVVLKAVIAAVEVMQSAVNPFLAILKIAVLTVQTANALNQISQAEKALEASRGESIQAVTNVQGLASGGLVTSPGIFRVGEMGPETVMLPGAARVLPNSASGGQSMVINVHMNGSIQASQESAREFAQQVAGYVSEFIDRERERL